jgi:hypothetical protein
MLPISSKKSVPLSASSKRPFFEYTAPVKAPLTWPKRFDSRRSCGSDPELTTMKGLSEREELVWMALATSSLPVPLSPDHEDGGARGRRLRDQVEDLLHARALAHDLGEAGLVLEGAPQVAVLVLEPPLLQPVAQDVQHLFVLEGLGDVVEGPALHGLDGRLHGGEGGDHQDDQLGIDLLDLLEHVEAAHLREHDVRRWPPRRTACARGPGPRCRRGRG